MHFPYPSTTAMDCIPSGKSKIPQFHKLKTCMHSRVPRTVIHLQTIPPLYLLITDISLLWNPFRSTSDMTVRKKYMSDIQLLMPAAISITPKPNSDAQFCLPHHWKNYSRCIHIIDISTLKSIFRNPYCKHFLHDSKKELYVWHPIFDACCDERY
jgi:hypothetical protein